MAASQSRAVLSLLPVRMVLPSGLNATVLTWFSCRMGGPRDLPVAASQSCAVRRLPVRMDLPSGLNAAAGRRLDASGEARWAGPWPRPRAAPFRRLR